MLFVNNKQQKQQQRSFVLDDRRSFPFLPPKKQRRSKHKKKMDKFVIKGGVPFSADESKLAAVVDDGKVVTISSVKIPKQRQQQNKRRKQLSPEQQIQKAQSGTDFLIPRAVFTRLAHENGSNKRWEYGAISALRVAAEDHIIAYMLQLSMCANHAGRAQINKGDTRLVNAILSDPK